ncbi:MAG: TetR/AcrR family transcriptional regulator [Pseudomonadota bacterium]
MSEIAAESETKREQIIQAATAEFQENGFAAASMDRISARASVSKRTVYRYFESKEALFQTLITEHWSKFAESLSVTYEPGRDIREQLAALGRAEGRLLTSPDVMATTRMVMSELLRSPGLAGQSQEKIDFKASFETMLSEATADGRLDVADPQAAAKEFLALLKARAFWPVIFGEPVVSEEEMEQIVDSSVEMMISRYGVK